MYLDANGELDDRWTIYRPDGIVAEVDYDVTVAQNQLGVADFNTEVTNNDDDFEYFRATKSLAYEQYDEESK